jgi:hypothetical protein
LKNKETTVVPFKLSWYFLIFYFGLGIYGFYKVGFNEYTYLFFFIEMCLLYLHHVFHFRGLRVLNDKLTIYCPVRIWRREIEFDIELIEKIKFIKSDIPTWGHTTIEIIYKGNLKIFVFWNVEGQEVEFLNNIFDDIIKEHVEI